MIALLGTLCASPIIWRGVVKHRYDDHIRRIDSVSDSQTAIVFGAAVYRNGRLSTVLRDRMDTAVDLYRLGKVQKILVSGSIREPSYNEPAAMATYAMTQGIPFDAIMIDDEGIRTFDTCKRARDVFGLRSAILVTQAFHLPRALFTCNRLGIDAVGVIADSRPYRAARWYELRETAASLLALWDVTKA